MTLSEYLAKEDLKPSHLAAKMGVPASTVTRILRGERGPSWRVMAKIAEVTKGEVSTPADYPGKLEAGEAA